MSFLQRSVSHISVLLAACLSVVDIPQVSIAQAAGQQAERGGSGGTKSTSLGTTSPLKKIDIDRWMTELSNWGRWGKDDQLGTVNLITPAKRLQATHLVKTGSVVSLAHNSSVLPDVDNMPPFVQKMLTTGADASALFAIDQYIETYHGEGVTHLDALAHMFYGDKLFNSVSRASVTARGAEKLDVLQLKNGIFGRAILVDIPAQRGRAYLDPGENIYPGDLDAWMREKAITLEAGDIVIVRTGRWRRRSIVGPWDVVKASAGLDASCAQWFHEHDVSVLGSDVESDAMPSGVQGVWMPIHLLSLAAMGMPLLDNLDLEELAKTAVEQHRWTFLLTLAPEAVPGGTGSPINPTAIF